ncbi:BrnT family toxin [Gammaproteobacteria bacterium]|nr:BrnT family toxin [Gammaproteobacteria bacterium]
MSDLSFEWDPKKNRSNVAKHGVSFEEAETVFTDQFARLMADPDHSENEDRFILLGTSIHSRLLVICHCERSSDTIRLISARKADKAERQIYEEFRDA